jgi:flagellar biosynthesis GTPase FlhF
VSGYEQACAALHQAAFGDFVAERKRLAAELKAAGDKDGSARLLKVARPPVSVWAVNQLWWRERRAFEALVSAASRVKVGDREASQAHREALAKLRELATQILLDGGNGASEATLRRVTMTLSALAAAGGFEPDAPGELSADRDPPGFEALGFGAAAGAAASGNAGSASASGSAGADADADAAEEAAARREREREAEVERKRAEQEERSRRLAERERLSTTLRQTQALRETQQHELLRLKSELERAERGLKETQALIAEIEEKLASLSG